MGRKIPLADRLWTRLVWTSEDCLEWQGALCVGYGVIQERTRRRAYVHRLVYERLVGPVPKGLHLDHLCRNRRCANPMHLEPVTPRVNVLRSPVAPAALNAAKTHCPHGHPFDDRNTYLSPDGQRGCRACRIEAKRRWRTRNA